jgi:hypothetical protein
MRPRPATRAASFVDLSPCFLAVRDSETTVLVRQRSQGVPLLPVLAESRDSKNQDRTASAVASGPTRSKSGGGGRNARATGTHSRARFRMSPGNSPSRIASCHRRHRNHRSASRKSSHVFAEFTLRQNVACRNGKTFRACAEAVDDESSLWKTEEICATIGRNSHPDPSRESDQEFNNLDAVKELGARKKI